MCGTVEGKKKKKKFVYPYHRTKNSFSTDRRVSTQVHFLVDKWYPCPCPLPVLGILSSKELREFVLLIPDPVREEIMENVEEAEEAYRVK